MVKDINSTDEWSIIQWLTEEWNCNSFVWMGQPEREIKNDQALKKLGARLRELRKQKGFTTAEAAANYYEIQRSQYARYEAGHNLYYLTLVEILDKMGISLSEFFREGFD